MMTLLLAFEVTVAAVGLIVIAAFLLGCGSGGADDTKTPASEPPIGRAA